MVTSTRAVEYRCVNEWVDAMTASRAAAALHRKGVGENPCEDDTHMLVGGIGIISSLDAFLTDILVGCGVHVPLKDERAKDVYAIGMGAKRYLSFDEAMKRLGVGFGGYHEEIQSYLRCLNGLLNLSQGSGVGAEEMGRVEQFFAAYSAAVDIV